MKQTRLVRDMKADTCKDLCLVHSAAWFMYQTFKDIAGRKALTRRQLNDIIKTVNSIEGKLRENDIRQKA